MAEKNCPSPETLKFKGYFRFPFTGGRSSYGGITWLGLCAQLPVENASLDPLGNLHKH